MRAGRTDMLVSSSLMVIIREGHVMDNVKKIVW